MHVCHGPDKNGTNGKVGKNGTFSVLEFGVWNWGLGLGRGLWGSKDLTLVCHFYLKSIATVDIFRVFYLLSN